MGIKKEIGVISNKNYPPSILAANKIAESLKGLGYQVKIYNLEDLIKKKIKTSYNFNVFYGEIGDGGIINNLLKDSGKICIGNSEKTCAYMLNKIITKKILEENKINTPKYWYEFNNNLKFNEISFEVKKLGFPIIAKLVNGSASEGMFFIKDHKHLVNFIKKNLSLINNGLIFFEKYIEGTELSCGFINGIGIDLPVVEIKIFKGNYQSQKIKFGQNQKENIIPANISKNTYKLSQTMSKKIHKLFNCRAFSRTDMIFSKKENKLYVLETNTNPGLLPTSLLPLLAKHAGYDYKHMIEKIITKAKLTPRD